MAVVLGITGGIASGKSTVLKFFAQTGAQTLSADEIAHELLRAGSGASKKIAQRFGEAVVEKSGNIDRKALGEMVFADEQARADLEGIMHPPIVKELEKRIKAFRESGSGILAVEIPLLVECGLEKLVDKVIVVVTEHETQISRLTRRSLITPSQALQRLQSQLPIETKVSIADYVVDNNGHTQDTKVQVERIVEDIHLP